MERRPTCEVKSKICLGDGRLYRNRSVPEGKDRFYIYAQKLARAKVQPCTKCRRLACWACGSMRSIVVPRKMLFVCDRCQLESDGTYKIIWARHDMRRPEIEALTGFGDIVLEAAASMEHGSRELEVWLL